ncbi:hypothetical protein PBY51_019805 [Eleginops maclovinus]|uniref:Uncharacterized protein n=1 Tax=Eleginops maclovinus TaxID=56733 RepID=A0AAN7XTB4_ELEMC|nr:hypothetical protein PBY51_019805 [Eleginops maclovinus]
MATASVVGRPLASRPPHLQEEPANGFHFPLSDRMTTSMTNWNHQANIIHQHHHRRASTVQITMEEMSIQSGRRCGWGCGPHLSPLT